MRTRVHFGSREEIFENLVLNILRLFVGRFEKLTDPCSSRGWDDKLLPNFPSFNSTISFQPFNHGLHCRPWPHALLLFSAVALRTEPGP